MQSCEWAVKVEQRWSVEILPHRFFSYCHITQNAEQGSSNLHTELQSWLILQILMQLLQVKITYLSVDGPVSPWILQKQSRWGWFGCLWQCFSSVSWAVMSPGPSIPHPFSCSCGLGSITWDLTQNPANSCWAVKSCSCFLLSLKWHQQTHFPLCPAVWPFGVICN